MTHVNRLFLARLLLLMEVHVVVVTFAVAVKVSANVNSLVAVRLGSKRIPPSGSTGWLPFGSIDALSVSNTWILERVFLLERTVV